MLNSIKKGCRLMGSLFSILPFLGLIAACHSINAPDLEKIWIPTDFTSGNGTSLGAYQKIFTLYPNGNYSIIGSGNSFAIGRWSVSEKSKMVGFDYLGGNHDLDATWLCKKSKTDELEVEVYHNKVIDPELMEGTMKLKGFQTSKPEIFSMNANTWRIQPIMPESGEQIKSRVLAYLKFMEGLNEFCLENDLEPQALNCHPHPVHLRFGNHIRMAYSDELDSWNDCFYDSTQAVRGYQVLSGVFRQVKMEKTKNLAERNLSFIRQIAQLIQKNKPPNPI